LLEHIDVLIGIVSTNVSDWGEHNLMSSLPFENQILHQYGISRQDF
jgi:hypothetical protein